MKMIAFRNGIPCFCTCWMNCLLFGLRRVSEIRPRRNWLLLQDDLKMCESKLQGNNPWTVILFSASVVLLQAHTGWSSISNRLLPFSREVYAGRSEPAVSRVLNPRSWPRGSMYFGTNVGSVFWSRKRVKAARVLTSPVSTGLTNS